MQFKGATNSDIASALAHAVTDQKMSLSKYLNKFSVASKRFFQWDLLNKITYYGVLIIYL